MKAKIVLAGLALAVFGVWAMSADDNPRPRAAADKEALPAKEVQDFVLLNEKRPVLVCMHVTIDGKPFQTVWEEFVEYVFKSLDRDGDGMLSKEEAERTPPAALLFGNGFFGNVAYPSMADLDADKDGKVTLDELKAYYRNNGAAPFQFQVHMGPDLAQVGLAGLNQPPPSPTAGTITEALFDLLDTNKDGKLSKQELAAAPSVLLKFDLNDNELINIADVMTASEHLAPTPPIARPFPGGPGGPGPGARPAPPSGPLPVVLIVPGESTDKLVKELLGRYGKGRAVDAKTLSRLDLGLDEATFKLLDANGDGALDAGELGGFAKREPDLEFTVQLGRVGNKLAIMSSNDRPSPLAGRVHAAKDGAVFDLGPTWLDLVAGPLRDVPAVPPQQLRQNYKGLFATADKDGKGQLSSSQFEAIPVFRGMAKVVDRDGDGKVTEREMFDFLDQIQTYQNRARVGAVLLTYGDQGNGLFDLLDTNRDGRLSIREMRQAVKLLDVLDRDGDGEISRSKLPKFMRLNVSQGGVGNTQLPPRFANMARVLRPPQPPPARPTAGPLWFRKMDRNGDGDVSRREFLGTDEEFNAINTSGDGLISAEEAERWDAKMRKK
jgi:Ca2+-binding EF-hand superfamily protein